MRGIREKISIGRKVGGEGEMKTPRKGTKGGREGGIESGETA